MNIKKEIEDWNQKLESSLKKTVKKQIVLCQKQTDIILKLQNNLSNLEILTQNQALPIADIESFFCYSKSILNLESKTLTSILSQKIKLNLNTDNPFYKIYFRDIDKIIFELQQNLHELLGDTHFSVFILRHLQNKDIFLNDITESSLAKYFLFNLEKITDINYNLVSKLQNNLYLPETKKKIKWINQQVKNYTNYFFDSSNKFFKFELLQECYQRLLKKENRLREAINLNLVKIKLRLDSSILVDTEWNLETKNKIHEFLDENTELLKFTENPLIYQWLILHQDLDNMEKVEEPNIISQIKILKNNNKSLLEKLNETYKPSLNLQRRNMKLQNFTLPRTDEEVQNELNHIEIDGILAKLIDDKSEYVLKQNLKIFSQNQTYTQNLKKIKVLHQNIKLKDSIFNFKYQSQIDRLEIENKNIIQENKFLEEKIKEEKGLIDKFKTLKNSNSLDNSTLYETIEYKKKQVRTKHDKFKKTHLTSFKKAKFYKKIHQKNTLQLKNLVEAQKNIKIKKSEIKFKIGELLSEIQNKYQDIDTEKLDSILNYFLIKLNLEEIIKKKAHLILIENNKEELELESYYINMDEEKLETEIKSFISPPNLENYIFLGHNGVEYNIDIVRIVIKLIKFLYYYFNLELIKNNFSVFIKSQIKVDFKKLESNIFKLETKLNPIFFELKTQKLNFEESKKNELLKLFFKNNTSILKDYLTMNKKINNINLIIQNMKSKIKKIKNLENIILNK